jgi:hypothetical protein
MSSIPGAGFDSPAPPFEQAPAPEAVEGEVRDGGRTVFFGNLPFFTDKEGFQKLLNEFGTYDSIRWMSASFSFS